MAKSPCPISKTQFLDKAEPVKITIGNQEIVADKREFSTGSFGWYYNGKTTITVDGKPLSIQVGLNLTVVGSKEAERECAFVSHCFACKRERARVPRDRPFP